MILTSSQSYFRVSGPFDQFRSGRYLPFKNVQKQDNKNFKSLVNTNFLRQNSLIKQDVEIIDVKC